MKILLIQNLDMGVYLFRKELIEALIPNNEIYICTPNGQYVSIIKSMGCKYILCDFLERKGKNPFTDVKLLYFYYKTIQAIKPDAVLLFTLKPLIYGGLASRYAGARYFPNITGLGTENDFGKLLNSLLNVLMKSAFKKANCVFFQNSTAQKNMVSCGIVNGKNRLLPGSGVNLSKYQFSDYPTIEEGIRFLFVGRVRKDKGIEEFLYSIRKLHKEYVTIAADVVGDIEEDYKEIMKVVEDEGAIIVHGLVNDVIPFYKKAHCIVLPSYHEGMSNALLEAAAIGRPIIASDIPGCRESFDAEVSGFGCKERDRESLYFAMKKFVELPFNTMSEMGKAARKKVEREFDRRIVINAYLEELHNNSLEDVKYDTL